MVHRSNAKAGVRWLFVQIWEQTSPIEMHEEISSQLTDVLTSAQMRGVSTLAE